MLDLEQGVKGLVKRLLEHGKGVKGFCQPHTIESLGQHTIFISVLVFCESLRRREGCEGTGRHC